MSGMGDDREQRAESVPAGKRRAVSIPRRFTGYSSSSSRSREGRVDRGFRTGSSSEGEGEVRRFTRVRGRTVDAVVKEEGKDQQGRNKQVRSDILRVRLGISFQRCIRI